MAVGRTVPLVEVARDRVEVERFSWQRDRQLERLAEVAKVERALEALGGRGEALGDQALDGGGLHLRPRRLDRQPPLAQEADAGAHVVVLDVGDEQPQRREVARIAGHQDAGHGQLLGDERRVHRPRAAEGHQREVARIVAARDRDLPDRGRHARDGDAHDALGQRLDAEAAQPVRQGRHRRSRDGTIQANGAAEHALGAHPAQDDVGVGDRRLLAAPSVGGWTRSRPGAARAHLQAAVDVEPGEAAAARANGVNVDLRHLHRERADLTVGAHGRRPVAHEADVRAGPAHVVRDEVGQARMTAEETRLTHSAGRPRHDRPDRQAARRVHRHHAAARAHREHAVRVARLEQALLEVAEVALHQRLQVRVEDRGREPLELPILGDDIERERGGDGGQAPPEKLSELSLVSRIGVCVQETDRDRLGAGRGHGVEDRRDFGRIERTQHRAVGEHALVDLEPERPVDDGSRPDEGRHEQGRNVALGAPDLDEVAKSGGREQRDAGATSLEDGVGADRRPMHESSHRVAIDTDRVEPREDRRGLVQRLRGDLADPDLTRCRVHVGDIGERPADVDAHDEHVRRVSSPHGRRADRHALGGAGLGGDRALARGSGLREDAAPADVRRV